MVARLSVDLEQRPGRRPARGSPETLLPGQATGVAGMRGLRGKRVLISGGSSGIGLATAERFLEEGSRVFLCGLDPREVEAAVAGLAAGGDIAGLACDVSVEADVEIGRASCRERVEMSVDGGDLEKEEACK